MIDKIVIDPEMEVTPNTLAAKLNEVLDVVNNPVMRAGRPVVPAPTNLQHAELMEMMAKRLQSGPLLFISQHEPDELTKAVADTLGKFQEAVEAYKASLADKPETG